MSLAITRKVLIVLLVLFCILYLLFILLHQTWLACLAVGTLLLFVICSAAFWRCPNCGKNLGPLSRRKYCAHCGKELDA